MRLKSALWAAAYIRRCESEGAFAAIRRRGAEEAGAIFIKINRLDKSVELFGPAPQTVFDGPRPSERIFIRTFGDTPVEEGKAEERLEQETGFDPDLWIIEVEDRQDRNFLDHIAVNE